jgi:hypothetical protein
MGVTLNYVIHPDLYSTDNLVSHLFIFLNFKQFYRFKFYHNTYLTVKTALLDNALYDTWYI